MVATASPRGSPARSDFKSIGDVSSHADAFRITLKHAGEVVNVDIPSRIPLAENACCRTANRRPFP